MLLTNGRLLPRLLRQEEKGDNMTIQETQELITTIAAVYSTFKPSDKVATLESWAWALKEYQFREVSQALSNYIKTGNSGFAPSVSQLISLIHREEDLSNPSEAEAWMLVRKACESLDWYLPEKEFYKLPTIIQKAVVTPAALVEWARLDMNDFETVISSNFKREYRAVLEKSKEISSMSEEAKVRIEASRNKILTEGGLYARTDVAKQLADSSGKISEEV